MVQRVFLAIDIGASSGRHLAGKLNAGKLELVDVYRFDNGPVAAAGQMYWDLLAQWSAVIGGLRLAAVQFGRDCVSVGVDTWGVDFALVGRGDVLLGNPVHYRDRRTNGMLERAFALMPRRDIFQCTGLQFMQLNTLYQLLAMRLADSPILAAAESLLLMPDVFHWLLSGVKSNEETNASTTQFFDPRTRGWSGEVFQRLDLPKRILGPITPPGTNLGPLRPDVAEATGLAGVNVVLPGTHDTASAVLAVPAAGAAAARPDWCYISSGTWSLMGVEIPQPIVSERCLALNFTNEAGVGGTIRLLKNIAGLWLVQECRRAWRSEGRDYSWDELSQLAAEAPRLVSLINPDDGRFLAPANMPQAIRDYCRERGQTVPESAGSVIRTAIESLALKYRQVLSWLESLVGGRIGTIHVVGGGTQNRALCQATADACARPVLAGPVEATAIGNIMMQAVAAGDVGSIVEAREVVRRSFAVESYEPRDTAVWDEAYGRFLALSPDVAG